MRASEMMKDIRAQKENYKKMLENAQKPSTPSIKGNNDKGFQM
jgi:hypothetical protein